ncbi:cell division control protein 2 homolog 2-like [Vicia villosa]|uniref:cell division control protein 2 homolog 2-like n=1 Tax=Vicia villosa TaxID=3911 RepID=UPI00273CECF0|nr:cell division control protein 2 homolog 2-like [Vicia villosa]
MGINKLEDLWLQQHDIMIPKLSINQAEYLLRFHRDLERIRIDNDMCFANVIKCIRRSSDETVAIKILTIPQHQQKNGIPSTILNHASSLRDLNHDNIVRLLQILSTEEDVYLVFDHVDLNLERYITNHLPSIATFERCVLYQALSGLTYLHSHHIVHTDINPFNILVECHLDDESSPTVKLCGIPAPKTSIHKARPNYTAPELLMGSTNYSTAADIWSMGCIFAHIIKRRPLFNNLDEHGVLAEIFCLFGTPTEETWPRVSSICNFLQEFNPPVQPKDLAKEFPSLGPTGLDLLSRMLCLCPNGRISANEALDHPYLQLFSNGEISPYEALAYPF